MATDTRDAVGGKSHGSFRQSSHKSIKGQAFTVYLMSLKPTKSKGNQCARCKCQGRIAAIKGTARLRQNRISSYVSRVGSNGGSRASGPRAPSWGPLILIGLKNLSSYDRYPNPSPSEILYQPLFSPHITKPLNMKLLFCYCTYCSVQ